MARVGVFHGGIVYLDAPPASDSYNLFLPDVIGNVDSRRKFDAIAAVHLRVKRWVCTGSASVTKSAEIAEFEESGCPAGQRTYSTTYTGSASFVHRYSMTIFDFLTSTPDLYTDPDSADFTERLFAVKKTDHAVALPLHGVLTPYPASVGATFDSLTTGMSGADSYGDAGGIGACAAYDAPFSGVDDPGGLGYWYTPIPTLAITISVWPHDGTYDVYAAISADFSLTGRDANAAGFYFDDDVTAFSTSPSSFTNPQKVGDCIFRVMAYQSFSPPSGEITSISVPIYIDNPAAYSQSGSASLLFESSDESDSILPYGHPGYTTSNAIWSNAGAVMQNPLAPDLNEY